MRRHKTSPKPSPEPLIPVSLSGSLAALATCSRLGRLQRVFSVCFIRRPLGETTESSVHVRHILLDASP
eukprot:scaffold57_cov254-Pinguiococcus_pyrenoidosus.AAC.45